MCLRPPWSLMQLKGKYSLNRRSISVRTTHKNASTIQKLKTCWFCFQWVFLPSLFHDSFPLLDSYAVCLLELCPSCLNWNGNCSSWVWGHDFWSFKHFSSPSILQMLFSSRPLGMSSNNPMRNGQGSQANPGSTSTIILSRSILWASLILACLKEGKSAGLLHSQYGGKWDVPATPFIFPIHRASCVVTSDKWHSSLQIRWIFPNRDKANLIYIFQICKESMFV